MNTRFHYALILSATLLFSGTASAAPQYKLTELLPLQTAEADGSASNAYGINDHGVAVGWSDIYWRSPPASVYWVNGVASRLPGRIGYDSAHGINNHGHIIGTEWDDKAILWKNGIFHELTVPFPTYWTEANGINDNGIIVGAAANADYKRAGYWENESYQQLSQLYSFESSAKAVNEAGKIVGYSNTSSALNASSVATVWENGNVIALDGFSANAHSQANAVNDLGHVVGFSTDASGNRLAAFWDDSGVTSLGALAGFSQSEALGINDAGFIVGLSTHIDEFGRQSRAATLWADGQIYNLQDLIENLGADWVVFSVNGINAKGQIVGTAYIDDGFYPLNRGYVLTPVPEPSHLALLLAGIGLLCMSKRRQA